MCQNMQPHTSACCSHIPYVVLCPALPCPARFLAQSIFPELHKGCHAFMRHKDILLSPGLLRTYGIEYMQVGLT